MNWIPTVISFRCGSFRACSAISPSSSKIRTTVCEWKPITIQTSDYDVDTRLKVRQFHGRPSFSIGSNARKEGSTRRMTPSLGTLFRDSTAPFLPLGGG